MRISMQRFMLLTLILLFISLACSLLTGGGEIVHPLDNENNMPFEPATPTATAVPPTERPTNIPSTATSTAAPQKFFKEEFDANSKPDNWAYFIASGDDSNFTIEQKNDGLIFDLGSRDLYVYYLYEGQVYENAALTLVAENRGVNKNNVSLVCRLDYENAEWYEYSFDSGGLWALWAYQDGYNLLDNGGSNSLKQGLAVNEYAMTCDGNDITMYVNGEKLKTYTDRKYFFIDGQVGFNISSFDFLPVTVKVKSFDIADP